MDIEQLWNKGISFINEKDIPESEFTVVVVGPARGGTSLVAGSLDKLGIYMGEKSHAPVYEDVVLSEAFEKKDAPGIQNIVARYNQASPIWAWKRPSAIDYLEQVHRSLRNPRYIFIFKDILSVSNRNVISMQANLLDNMAATLQQYRKMLDFIAKFKPAAMLVSYDKVLYYKSDFIDSLAQFVDIRPSQAQLDGINSFITHNPEFYLDCSRNTRTLGYIDVVTRHHVAGWAKRQVNNQPVLVQVFVNDKFVGETLADRFRQDLLDGEQHTTGLAGFDFDFPAPLAEGDRVRVRAEKDIRDLGNSPYRFATDND